MVTQARAFDAIADPIRRSILDLLRDGECSAGEIANRFPVSRPAVSRHLRVLRRSGLVKERRHAQCRIYRLDPEPLREVDSWLNNYRTFWAARLHDLKSYVERKEKSR